MKDKNDLHKKIILAFIDVLNAHGMPIEELRKPVDCKTGYGNSEEMLTCVFILTKCNGKEMEFHLSDMTPDTTEGKQYKIEPELRGDWKLAQKVLTLDVNPLAALEAVHSAIRFVGEGSCRMCNHQGFHELGRIRVDNNADSIDNKETIVMEGIELAAP